MSLAADSVSIQRRIWQWDKIQPPPLAEFSYDEEKLEILGKFYKQKGIKKSKKGKSTQELELEKGVNELIDGYMDQLQLRQTVNQDLDDTFVDVKNTKKKLVGEVECSFLFTEFVLKTINTRGIILTSKKNLRITYSKLMREWSTA
jgi:hypothetical protein